MRKKEKTVLKKSTDFYMNKPSFIEAVEDRRVLFITTKNIDYIRNAQEIRTLENKARMIKKIYSSRKSYIGRIIEIWFKLLLCRNSDFDCVFVGFAPQLVSPFFKKFHKNEIIIDFFISVYDTLVNDRKIFLQKSMPAKLCHKLDTYVINKADLIIADTKADRDYFISEFGGNRDRFEVLYLEADKSIYYPRAKDNKQHKGKFVVLYFGSVLPLQGVDIVLEAARRLKDLDNILIQIIGPISKSYNKPMQSNIEYIEWLSQEKLAEHIANGDLCLAGHFNATIDKAKRTIPSKAYIYAAMNIPMILGDSIANRELFGETEQTYYVSMGNSRQLADIISKIYFSCLKKDITY